MIGKLYGLVDSISKDQVIINVSGVGYLVSCSFSTIAKMNVGEKVQLFVDTQMKESQITLYGFSDSNEKECFLKLITIKGLGPKLALAILGVLTADQIYLSIAAKDKNAFTAVSGVGSKIVNRLFTELKAEDFCLESNIQTNKMTVSNSLIQDDAISALVKLGINKSDAYTRVSRILLSNKDIDLNTLIKEALSNING